MNIEFAIAIPGFITGMIIGAAFVVSRITRSVLLTGLAALLIWIFVESGDHGIVSFFESIYHDRILENQMFFIPLIIGLVAAVIFTNEARKPNFSGD